MKTVPEPIEIHKKHEIHFTFMKLSRTEEDEQSALFEYASWQHEPE